MACTGVPNNSIAHLEIMYEIGVEQRGSLSPTLFNMYINVFETCFDEIDTILCVYLTCNY